MTIEEIDDQPTGTTLIFENNLFPMLTKMADGRWGMTVMGSTEPMIMPLNPQVVLLWWNDSNGQCAMY